MALRTPRIAIVGAGMSGICAGAMLNRAGITTFTVYEKNARPGGTWRDNTYPGLACDVPSRFYQFTFAMNPDWSRRLSPGAEIQEYFTRVSQEFGVTERTRYSTTITEARWTGSAWAVTADDGTCEEYDFLISATGILHHPQYPDIEGLETFAGPCFHSARWDHTAELAGQRVAMIGTGSTGVQILGELAGTASQFLMFQRTPHWVVQLDNPTNNRLVTALHRRFPTYDRLSYYVARGVIEALSPAMLHPGRARRLISWYARKQLKRIEDPALRAALTPTSEPLCRRMIVSTNFYDAVQRPDVSLISTAIERIEPDGVRTTDGTLHGCDVLILATGFDAHAYLRPINLVGTDGRTLDDAWAEGPRAYRTVAMPGFPNFFFCMGPNSPVGNYALTAIAEEQVGYALGWIQRWQRGEVETAAPTEAATEAFYDEVRAAMPDTVWTTGCQSWYIGETGEPELFPWAPQHFRALMADPVEADFTVTRAPVRSRSS